MKLSKVFSQKGRPKRISNMIPAKANRQKSLQEGEFPQWVYAAQHTWAASVNRWNYSLKSKIVSGDLGVASSKSPLRSGIYWGPNLLRTLRKAVDSESTIRMFQKWSYQRYSVKKEDQNGSQMKTDAKRSDREKFSDLLSVTSICVTLQIWTRQKQIF